MEEEGHQRDQEQHERMLRGMKVFRLGSRLIRAGSYFQQQALLRSLLVGGNLHCYPKKPSGDLRPLHTTALLLLLSVGATAPQSSLMLRMLTSWFRYHCLSHLLMRTPRLRDLLKLHS